MTEPTHMQIGPLHVHQYATLEPLLVSLGINDVVAMEPTPHGLACYSMFKLSTKKTKHDRQLEALVEWMEELGGSVRAMDKGGKILPAKQSVPYLKKHGAKRKAAA